MNVFFLVTLLSLAFATHSKELREENQSPSSILVPKLLPRPPPAFNERPKIRVNKDEQFKVKMGQDEQTKFRMDQYERWKYRKLAHHKQ
jgi:hypothetical protein